MKRFLFAFAVLMAFGASAAANPVIGFYTGGDPGEGLDFQGQFAYAIDFGSPTAPEVPPGTIGNATFTNYTSTPGATNVANMEDDGFFQMGTTAADAALKSLVDTGRWADGTTNITSNLTVQPGRQYLLQLIFQEGWNATAAGIRTMNIDVEGVRVATNFDINAITGPQPVNRSVTPNVLGPNTRGAFLRYQFTASDSTANILLSRVLDNPRLEGLTLEIVPEPTTLAILSVLLVSCGLATRRWRCCG